MSFSLVIVSRAVLPQLNARRYVDFVPDIPGLLMRLLFSTLFDQEMPFVLLACVQRMRASIEFVRRRASLISDSHAFKLALKSDVAASVSKLSARQLPHHSSFLLTSALVLSPSHHLLSEPVCRRHH